MYHIIETNIKKDPRSCLNYTMITVFYIHTYKSIFKRAKTQFRNKIILTLLFNFKEKQIIHFK